MIKSYSRGNLIFYRNDQWKYEDGTPLDIQERPCARCGKSSTPEGYDHYSGYIPGIVSACCGHGVEEGYILKEGLK